jgi:hypothetical protein
MSVVSQRQNTAGSYGGHAAAQNPVPCDSGSIQYNLNMGTYTFAVQASDVTVSFPPTDDWESDVHHTETGFSVLFI